MDAPPTTAERLPIAGNELAEEHEALVHERAAHAKERAAHANERAAHAHERAAHAEERAAHAQASKAHACEAFLSATSARLSALIPNVTAETIAELTVPWFAEHCAVEIIDSARGRVVALASADETRLELPETAFVRPHHVRAELFDDLEAALHAAEEDTVRQVLLKAVQPRSLLVVPISACGGILGRLLLATRARTYDAADLALAEELCRRVGTAFEHSYLYQDLHGALRSRDDVLAMLSHDLMQQIQALRLLHHSARTDPTAGLEAADHCLNVMMHFVGGLLDLGRIDTDALVIRPRVERVGPIVEEAILLVQPQVGPRMLADIPEGLQVLCDRNRLLQVLYNLLGNAGKFAHETAAIRVSARLEREWVRFSVEDTGPGITSADQAHLFERYWRAQPDRFPGYGLGLFIVRKIVEAHDGKIWVESEPGRGCTFHFTLARPLPMPTKRE